jgi:hypothetical protein
MIHITAYRTINGHRGELIPYEVSVSTLAELNTVKRELMKRTGKQVDLVYHTKPDEAQVKEPEPEQKIEVHVKDLSSVIARNKINLHSFVESYKI